MTLPVSTSYVFSISSYVSGRVHLGGDRELLFEKIQIDQFLEMVPQENFVASLHNEARICGT